MTFAAVLWSERAVKLSKREARQLSKYQSFRVQVSSNLKVSDVELSSSYGFQTSSSEPSRRVKLSISRTFKPSSSETPKLQNPLKLSNSRPGPAVFALRSGTRFKLSNSLSLQTFELQTFDLRVVHHVRSSFQTLKRSKLEKSTRDTYPSSSSVSTRHTAHKREQERERESPNSQHLNSAPKALHANRPQTSQPLVQTHIPKTNTLNSERLNIPPPSA